MNNFFSLIEELEGLLTKLNTILSGSDNETVNVNGINKDSISKAIKDNFSAIQTMVQGRVTFKTLAQMNADLTHAEDTLGEVWDDDTPENNGLYGKEGESGAGSWKRSKYDTLLTVNNLESMENNFALQTSYLDSYISNVQRSISESLNNDSVSKKYVWGVVDENNQLALAVDKSGNLEFRPTDSAMKNIISEVYESPDIETQIVWGVIDENGKIALGLNRNGELIFKRSDEINLPNIYSKQLVWGVCDEEGKVALSLNAKGELSAKLDKETLLQISENTRDSSEVVPFVDNRHGGKDKLYIFDSKYDFTLSKPKDGVIDMIIHAGQSLSVGGGAVFYKNNDIPEQAIVSKSNDNPEFCLMLNTGSRSTEMTPVDTSLITHLKPIVESFDGSRIGETQGSGLLNKLHTLLEEGGNLNHTWLYRTHGAGGRSYSQIKKGTVPYSNCMSEIYRAQEICNEYGLKLRVKALFITHGEADMGINNTNYDSDLAAFISDYKNDVQLTTNQSEELLVLVDQMPTPRTAIGHKIQNDQVEVADLLQNCFLTQPKYQYDFVDSVHLTAKGYRLAGEKQGAVLKDVITSGEWQPLKPLTFNLNGNVIDILFHVPKLPLTFDTALISPAENYGFFFEDDEQTSSIESIEIVNQNTVRITLTEAPTGNNPRISYAFDMPTGNLRDSDTTLSNFDKTPLPNWSVAFEKSL